ncbi:MAG: plasmid pRiA4b ORF-3 family protein [Saprospiraceae bacterium]|nr:plasmid pRiA4b ORF-3 family protein [Saprospiraceae bacterium]
MTILLSTSFMKSSRYVWDGELPFISVFAKWIWRYPCFELKTPDSDTEFSPISNLKKEYELTYDSSKAKLSDYFMEVKDRITYIYDFGDDWKHSITLIKITPLKLMDLSSRAVKGKCPPEDCGGIWGYEGLIDTVNDPKNPEYEDSERVARDG